MCIRAENVVLPKNGFFGVSAATGGLADDHDVLKANKYLNEFLSRLANALVNSFNF